MGGEGENVDATGVEVIGRRRAAAALLRNRLCLEGPAISDQHDPVARLCMCEIYVFGCGAVPHAVLTGARPLRVLGLRRRALNAVWLIAVIKIDL